MGVGDRPNREQENPIHHLPMPLGRFEFRVLRTLLHKIISLGDIAPLGAVK